MVLQFRFGLQLSKALKRVCLQGELEGQRWLASQPSPAGRAQAPAQPAMGWLRPAKAPGEACKRPGNPAKAGCGQVADWFGVCKSGRGGMQKQTDSPAHLSQRDQLVWPMNHPPFSKVCRITTFPWPWIGDWRHEANRDIVSFRCLCLRVRAVWLPGGNAARTSCGAPSLFPHQCFLVSFPDST